MGMYDEVLIPCPTCGNRVYEQSKGGACILKLYNFEAAPANVLSGLLDEPIFCDECKTRFKIVLGFKTVQEF